MHKIKYTNDGTIQAIGIEVDGHEIDETTLPEDFMQTFGMGKYKAQQEKNGKATIVEVPGFVMPEKSMYTIDEIQKMSKEQLLELQAKLQNVIDQKAGQEM